MPCYNMRVSLRLVRPWNLTDIPPEGEGAGRRKQVWGRKGGCEGGGVLWPKSSLQTSYGGGFLSYTRGFLSYAAHFSPMLSISSTEEKSDQRIGIHHHRRFVLSVHSG